MGSGGVARVNSGAGLSGCGAALRSERPGVRVRGVSSAPGGGASALKRLEAGLRSEREAGPRSLGAGRPRPGACPRPQGAELGAEAPKAALSEREAGPRGGALAPRGVSSAPGGGASA